MDEKILDDMALDLMSPLYKWLGPKRILTAMAKLEMGEARAMVETWKRLGAEHNAEILEDTARMISD